MWEAILGILSSPNALLVLIFLLIFVMILITLIATGNLKVNGYSQDRDVHAAKNVKLFGSTKRAECLEQASVETLASATSA